MNKTILILMVLLLANFALAELPPPPDTPAPMGGSSASDDTLDLPPEPAPIETAQQTEPTSGLPPPPQTPSSPGSQPQQRQPEQASDINYPVIFGIVGFVFVVIAVVFFVLKKKKPVVPFQQPITPQPTDPNPQLTNYIRSNLSTGYTSEQIKQTLVSSGYKEEDINLSFSHIQRGA